MVKLSKTSKLDGILSWSLQAIDTCPGSIGPDGKLVDACSGCYATDGNYRFANVKAPRLFNREDWKRAEWVTDMVQALNNSRFFRWFDSGDMYSIELAEKIEDVIRLTPHCQHWLPTRMHKFPKFRDVLNRINALPNAMVRFSSDSVSGEYSPGYHGSTIVDDASKAPTGSKVCEAYVNDGRCNGCRACWNKSIPLITYIAHGRKMRKVITIKKA